jgi:transposase-like protein
MAAHCLPITEDPVEVSTPGNYFNHDDMAREFLEAQRWPEGPVCPHCGTLNNAYRLHRKESKKGTHVRKGVWKCRSCREQFTVTVGTIMEDSHIPLSKWLLAIHLYCSSEKGISAHQLHQILKITYRSAWFMGQRIRYAATQESMASKLHGRNKSAGLAIVSKHDDALEPNASERTATCQTNGHEPANSAYIHWSSPMPSQPS